MRNLLAENTLQDKLIKDVRNSKDIILAERSGQTRGADTVKIKISSELETAVLTWAANETINIEVAMAPDNGILSVWNFLWQFLEYDAPTPVDTWHWPEGLNAGLETFGNTVVGGPSDIPITNRIRANHFTTGAGGDANSITTYLLVFNGTHSIKCAIYEYTALGNAGALVGKTEARNIPISVGWQTFNFAVPPTLSPTTNYYLAVWANNPIGANDARTHTNTISNKEVQKVQAYNGWPDPLTGESIGNNNIPIYCTLAKAHRVGQDFSINYTKDWAKSVDGIGRRNLFFSIKNLTGDTKYGVFAIKGYVPDPTGTLTENINVV